MRHVFSRLGLALGLILVCLPLAGAGKRKPTDPPRKPLKVDETIGDIALISSAASIRVEGVGLVIGLDGTGSNPSPSYYRQKLLDQMRKAGVENPDKLLASPAKAASLVIVRATIPPGITKIDHLDAEIELPGDSTTTSLSGGWLLAARLTEIGYIKGEAHEGQVLAVAGGPVLAGSEAKPNDLKAGRVLGGCRSMRDMPFAILIDTNHRSIRTSQRLQAIINQRFHQHEGVDEAGMATAESDSYLALKVPKIYHHNQARYFQVVKLLPVVSERADLHTQRLEKWGKELLDPKTAGVAALRLEGMGQKAIETLKQGIKSDNAQVRFFAAEALAYLDDGSGVDILAETATQQPQFRALALAALAAMDQAASTMRLRKLMENPDAVVRYGAFNAMRTQDEHNADLGRIRLIDDEPDETESTDSMEMKIATHSNRHKQRAVEPFELYVVDCDGPPLVHVSRTRRCEIVIFGKDLKLLTPVVLGNGGSILLNAADGDPTIQISRIMAQGLDRPALKVSSAPQLGEIVKESARMGATYPEIVAILQAADKQKNLPGPLVVDAVPGVSPAYDAALLGGVDATAKKDEAVQKAAATKTTKTEKPQRKRLLDRLFRKPAPAAEEQEKEAK